MKRCPKCGCEEFLVTAHIVQGWAVDRDGNFIEVVDDCEMVTHFPHDDDLWMCRNCTYEDVGSAFNVKEDK